MLEVLTRKLSRAEHIQDLLYKSYTICKKHSISKSDLASLYNERYELAEAVDELGLDDELVNQLLEDYVIQVLTTKTTFLRHLNVLKQANSNDKELDYAPLRELAHKNLGVARNLRVKDGEKVLNELMKKDDLEYLETCVEVLIACTIRLKPSKAYDTIKLLNTKGTF